MRGGLLRLPTRVPYHIAMELALTGEPMTAERAAHFGLVNRLTADGQALAEAVALARQIAENGPLAVAATKRVISESGDWPAGEAFERQRPISEAIRASARRGRGRARLRGETYAGVAQPVTGLPRGQDGAWWDSSTAFVWTAWSPW